MDFILLLLHFGLITFLHELAHYITAKYYGVYKGFQLTWWGIRMDIEYPQPLKIFLFIASAGLIFTLPLSIGLSIFYVEPIFFMAAIILSSMDLFFIFMALLERKINPFFNEVPGRYKIDFNFRWL